MTQDRTYWRAAKETALIEAARDSGHELCIALGDRLEQNCYADLEEEVSRLNAALEREQDRVAELERELEKERDKVTGLWEAMGELEYAAEAKGIVL